MLYLGIDGGGTKTAFALIDGEGSLLAFKKKPTCHYIQVGIDQFERILREGIKEVCQQAGKSISQIDYSFLGLPAYGDIAGDVPRLNEIIVRVLTSNQYLCGNDVEAGWAGSLACRPGINLVGGTGAIGFGRDHNGNDARASGWGYFCGDEGSAYWLGRKVISLFGKEADGRESKTPLYHIIKEEFNLKHDLDLISVVYNQLEKKRDKIARLALLLYRAAGEGDSQAIDLYRRAAYEHSLTVKALIQRLEFNSDKEILVSYAGGVFKAGAFILEPLHDYLSEEKVKLIKPILEPVTGAALYALLLKENLNDYEVIVERLRSGETRYKF